MQRGSKIVKFPQTKNQSPLKTNTKKKKRKIKVFNLVFLAFVLYFFMTVTSQKQMINALDKEIERKEADRNQLKVKADKLKEDVAQIDDQEVLLEVVERIARNEYKMVKPNEIIYIDKNKANNKFIMGIGYNQNSQVDESNIKIEEINSDN
ncbi:septum formation initiator family protein [Sedimentibacter sp. zth1]|uniref:FtsB family cell division protein n=1 Tax=Sedimentibacter sp. zth1 TaxID=2816908 RepID=UPI001F5EAE6D|nr:septum formation initiator family protein [Sedimentibacter sp. zth1]